MATSTSLDGTPHRDERALLVGAAASRVYGVWDHARGIVVDAPCPDPDASTDADAPHRDERAPLVGAAASRVYSVWDHARGIVVDAPCPDIEILWILFARSAQSYVLSTPRVGRDRVPTAGSTWLPPMLVNRLNAQLIFRRRCAAPSNLTDITFLPVDALRAPGERLETYPSSSSSFLDDKAVSCSVP